MKYIKENIKLYSYVLGIAIVLGILLGLFGPSLSEIISKKDEIINDRPSPTNSPMPTNTPTPIPDPTPTPTPTPIVWPGEVLDIQGYGNMASEDINKLSTKIFIGSEEVIDYKAEELISFGNSDYYSEIQGVTTFRGNNFRSAPSYGKSSIKEKKLEIIWEHNIGVIDIWPGVGWTGQPLLVNWPEDIRRMMNIKDEFQEKDLVEVIYATLDGNIYFLDMETGLATRETIDIGAPIKGTPLVDPRGFPILYCGQGVNENKDKGTKVPFQYRIFNLLNQELLFQIPGTDSMRLRNWGAFDSSGLVDRATDTFIECGENGLIYRVKLNTNFDKENKTLTMNPDIVKYQYKQIYQGSIGIENSPVIYRNILFAGDNSGLLQAIDLNTLKPIWIAELKDDTDSSIVLDETENGVFIYTANEVDNRTKNNGLKEEYSNIRKFNALTGELIWEKNYLCFYNSSIINGGALATPIMGKNDISNMVIFNIAKAGTPYGGKLIALDKETGEEIWIKDLPNYSWSSPVDFLGEDGKTYMVFCDFGGYIYLLDPMTGEELDRVFLGANVEGSPAIYNDTIVIGSYAKKIFGLKIK